MALNYDSSQGLLADWIYMCTECLNVVYHLNFSREIKPKLICAAGREFGSNTIISEMKVECSSSFLETLEFPNSRLRKCFNYSEDSLETGLKMWISKLYDPDGQNLRLAYLQVYILDNPQKYFDIETTEQLVYHLPSSLQNTITLSLSFGVKILSNGGSNCHSLIIGLLNETSR
ncbi:DgyrCDS14533 [Dimorphilus gyrociliatus]|uniref:DgyrCDS14533 n=1 Tax=Dimorphilus gyrociliatus TaxID=2664684 RepID=A0A7I8WEB2_9ANNE|nr:DgyrCDS14533 [Dimorphilus gyrociliatus]